MEEVVMAMKVRQALLHVDTNIDTREIMRSSRLVSRLCNMPVQPNKAVVGANAFAHSSGIHQDGVLKEKSTYEIMRPADIGLSENQLNLTSRSGRHVIKHRLEKLGYSEKDYKLEDIYAKFLELADKKGSVYDDDLEALVVLKEGASQDTFSIDYLNVTSGTKVIPTATIIVKSVKGQVQEASTGDGPVDAACRAIERATGISVNLTDYRISSNTGGKEAVGCVNIIAQYGDYRLHGVGLSTDIVEASALAYLNVVNKVVRLCEVRKARKKK
jgi:2-isopropylmalate synthase